MGNSSLYSARIAKNDEFYTQYDAVEREMEAYLAYDAKVFQGKSILLPCDDPTWSNFTKFFVNNFQRLGLNELVSTCFAEDEKPLRGGYRATLFERGKGKIAKVTKDMVQEGNVDADNLDWLPLKGDGDFRSPEVTALRDCADMIITNPPFSMFTEFYPWVTSSRNGCDFSIIGSINASTYSSIFPSLRDNTLWLGYGFNGNRACFRTPNSEELVSLNNCCWYTNIDHGGRHKRLELCTSDENKKTKFVQESESCYQEYDNYDAMEVSRVSVIPSDYHSVMGVPVTFLSCYCQDQFEILGSDSSKLHGAVPATRFYGSYWCVTKSGEARVDTSGSKADYHAALLGSVSNRGYYVNSEGRRIRILFKRIFIRHRNTTTKTTKEIPMKPKRAEITSSVTDMACRWLAKYMFSCHKEVGLLRRGRRRADIVAVNMKRLIVIVEVKSCWSDFATDKKWKEYLTFCDKFYFAVPQDFPLDRMELPEEIGILQDGRCVKKARVVKAVHSKRDLITKLAWHGGISRKTL